MLSRNLGPVEFFVDGECAGTIDCGELPPRFAERIGEEALKNQLLFDSGILQTGEHTISLIVREGSDSGKGCGAGIEAFDYVIADFAGECQADPRQGYVA